ncbi:ATPase [Acrocarpospora pleiomorpha]|uniref:ATPase n=1 Tax=Acrocarpospora pleiomorpha TaxID=90975 RepID=A0A5M3XFM3_9ACTN|nr:ATPase [Acrocarpospora pleiomorpha]
MDDRLLELRVRNFRSLRDITLPLGPVNVMVGPNGAGKTNVLEVFRFLADIVRTDLEPALERRGGLESILFRGDRADDFLQIDLSGTWDAQTVAGHYTLKLTGPVLAREERFVFDFADGTRRLTQVEGASASMETLAPDGSVREILAPPPFRLDESRLGEAALGINPLSSGLSTLSRLAPGMGGAQVRSLADFLDSFKIVQIDVEAAAKPSRMRGTKFSAIDSDASNLAISLLSLSATEAWEFLVADAVAVLPQLEDIDFEHPSGPAREVVVVLRERGLRDPTQLADASYGTIRLLSLLALLYDPRPPALTCIEEIDHGLHPQALELLVNRIREQSKRTQFLIATHSPAFANRLTPDELIVCERSADGSSIIPAISNEKVKEIVAASEGLPLGELWFSGALGGDL